MEAKTESIEGVPAKPPLPTAVRFAEGLLETLVMAEALKERRLAALKISVLTNQALDAFNNLTQKMMPEGKPWKK